MISDNCVEYKGVDPVEAQLNDLIVSVISRFSNFLNKNLKGGQLKWIAFPDDFHMPIKGENTRGTELPI